MENVVTKVSDTLVPVDGGPLFPKEMVVVASHAHLRAFSISASGTLKEIWDSKLEGSRSLDVEQMTVGNNCIYVGIRKHVYGFDVSGRMIWSVKPALLQGLLAGDLYSMTFLSEQNWVVVTGSGCLLALKADTGEVVWDTKLEFGTWSSWSCVTIKTFKLKGALVAAIGGIGHLELKDLNTRDNVWHNGLKGKLFGDMTVALFDPVVGTPLVIVGITGWLLFLDLKDGKTVQDINLKKGSFSPVALLTDSKHIYASSLGHMNCYLPNGEKKWESNLEGMSYAYSHSLCFANDGNILLGLKGFVAKINKETGETMWKGEYVRKVGEGMSIIPIGNYVVAGMGGKVKVYNQDTGKKSDSNSLKGLGYSMMVFASANHVCDTNASTTLHALAQNRRDGY